MYPVTLLTPVLTNDVISVRTTQFPFVHPSPPPQLTGATSGSTCMCCESIIFPQLQNPCAATANTSVKCSVWRGAGMRWRSWGRQAKADEGHSCTRVRRHGTRRAKRPRAVVKMAQRGEGCRICQSLSAGEKANKYRGIFGCQSTTSKHS